MSKIQAITEGHSLSLNNEPNESLKLHRRYKWCLQWPMNKMKWSTNEWTKQTLCLSYEDSLVEVPSIEPSFLWCIDLNSMIPRSHGIRMNDIEEVMCYIQNMLYTIWYVLCLNVMCCVKMWKVWRCMLFSIVQIHWLNFQKSCC